jgi:hypothetical protein
MAPRVQLSVGVSPRLPFPGKERLFRVFEMESATRIAIDNYPLDFLISGFAGETFDLRRLKMRSKCDPRDSLHLNDLQIAAPSP